MIFRAIFSIAFVAVFIPHEPDLGFGRPGTGGNPPIQMSELATLPAAARLCGNRQEACAAGLDMAGNLRETILSNLDRVKAELKASAQARSDQRRSIGKDLIARIMDF
jgi:hypothetical protein